MKKLLLVALATGGLAGVAALGSDAQNTTTVLVPRSEGLSFGFPSGYNGSPRYLNYYPFDIGLTTSSIGIIITPAGSPG